MRIKAESFNEIIKDNLIGLNYPIINAKITIIININAITYLTFFIMNSNINEKTPNITLLNRQIKNNTQRPINTNMIVPITVRACSIDVVNRLCLIGLKHQSFLLT